MGSDTFLLVGNGPYLNRGCEAIVRGTTKILRENFDTPRFVVVSKYHSGDGLAHQRSSEYDPDIVHEEIRSSYKRFDAPWFFYNIMRRSCPFALKHYFYANLKQYLPTAKAVLAIGGDNYSLDYGRRPFTCTALDDLIVDSGKPMVVWGASVGPFSTDPAYEKFIMSHFRKIHLIVRESKSYEYLASHGLHDNIHLVADPAFVLEPVQPSLEKWNKSLEKGAIGINLSPLMARYIGTGNMTEWEDLAVQIIAELMKRLDRPVYLIPHVASDYAFLSKVFKRLSSGEERLFLIPDSLNAAESKWIISQMHFFAGARTHATIAALSSEVPTLSFGYSIKSQGINSDIFGHCDYCLMPHDLTPGSVAERVIDMLQREHEVRSVLKHVIPEMKSLAFRAGDILNEIVDR